MRPTHFLALQLPGAALHDAIAGLQRAIVAKDASLSQCAVSPSKTHITLFVFNADTADRLSAARAAFAATSTTAATTIHHTPVAHLEGLDVFGKQVLFCALREPTEDMALVRALRAAAVDAFVAHGVASKAELDDRAWHPHVTLLKTSQAPRPRWGQPAITIQPAAYEGINVTLGVHPMPELSLCAMGGPTDPDGFYRRVAVARLGAPLAAEPFDVPPTD